ncbi:MAG: transcription termination/antitermination protein NusG [Elusimicrobiota bacterium]
MEDTKNETPVEDQAVQTPPEAETPAAPEAPAEKQIAGGKRGWYVVHAQSGWEDKVRQHLELKIKTLKLEHKIFKILIPTENVVEVKKSKKRVKKRKFFPGYILIDMVVDNETYWVVKGISGATGFLGEPDPRTLPESEIEQILELTTESAGSKPKPAVQFEKGENIRITEGPFRHFIGIVEDVNEPKAKLKAMVTIFGRPTPVELDFLQVEKL